MTPENGFETLDRGDGVRLAFQRKAGADPTLVWLSGFRSDMSGTKAETLAQWAESTGQSFLRLDYSGHGRSGGRFEAGTIGEWTGDALKVIDTATAGPLVLIGSSMGGWIALLAARARPERVKGLLLIAPAPDFTEALIWTSLSAAQQGQILAEGRLDMASDFGPEPTPITRALIEDGRNNLVLDRPIAFDGPVRILHGAADPEVPRWLVDRLVGALNSADVSVISIADGDHRLSRPEDLQLLTAMADGLARLLRRQKQD